MIYCKDDDVPEAWDHLIDAFMTLAEWDAEYNNQPEIYDVKFSSRRGLLFCDYKGGSTNTDAYARMAREISSTICKECGLPTDRQVFGIPLCEDC